MRNKLKRVAIAALMAGLFILLTALSATMNNWLGQLCFYIHLIPYGISFSGGSALTMAVYYLLLWLVLILPALSLMNFHKRKCKAASRS